MNELQTLLKRLAVRDKDSCNLGLPFRGRIRRWIRVLNWITTTVICPPDRRERLLLRGPVLIGGRGALEIIQSPAYFRMFGAKHGLQPFKALSAANRVGNLLSELGLDSDVAADVIVSGAKLIVFGHRNGRAAVAHWSSQPYSDRLLNLHAENLALLNDGPLRALVPIPMHSGTVGGRRVLVQTRLAGRRFRPELASDEAIRLHLSRAVDVLRLFSSVRAPRPGPPEESLLRDHLLGLPDALPMYASALRLALGRLRAWLDRRGLAPVPVHGDYGFHNILFDSAGAVVGVVDWDRFRQDGLPGYDALHLLMACMNESGECSYPEFLTSLWRREQRSTRFGQQLEYWRAMSGWSEQDTTYIGVLLWLDLVFRGCIETPPPDASWIDRVVGGPAGVLATDISTWAS